MTAHYGHYDDDKYPLAVRIWGHRLRSGQHWIEYMLEFLSVLSGFDYRLGQGLPDRSEPDYLDEYRIPHRLGLRRFVFYDDREKTRDSRDTQAVTTLRQDLGRLMPGADGRPSSETLEQVRSLLRSFSAIEDARSWYAKSLFPVHEEFLLWEGQRKGATLRTYATDPVTLTREKLDAGIEFNTRNFFARGGELYYLIISAGTEGRPALRAQISQRMRALLTQQNQNLGAMARVIDAAWANRSETEHYISGSLGWILDPQCALYAQIADELATFLDNDLDSLECLEMLAHLIGFHIVSYIYHRAHPSSDPEGHASGSCLEACRPDILVDLLGDEDGGVLRDRSAALLREQDDRQLAQARALIEQKLHAWAEIAPSDRDLASHLRQEVEAFFQIGQKRTRGRFTTLVREASETYYANRNREDLVAMLSAGVYETLAGEFRKNFLGVHRKVGRAIGLIAPRKGPQIRFVLDDTLLKTLVFALLGRGEQCRFGEFLGRLHARYGLVVGPGEAREAQLIERLRINEEYYTHNRAALLRRMERAGLVTQYSDATAIVRR